MEPNTAKQIATILVMSVCIGVPIFLLLLVKYRLRPSADADSSTPTATVVIDSQPAKEPGATGGHGSLPSAREATAGGATLTFHDVRYEVRTKGGATKRILKGVSGLLKEGTLTAVMGPSGCGKSTLLDVLADCKRTGVSSGDIRLNGSPRPPNYRTTAAYVMQSDNTHTCLTVRETLAFAAELRMGKASTEQCRARVQETLEDTDLAFVADNRIGDDVSGGLSGGQRRRVTVAIELINRPKLLFLDEPTSGLDAYGALQVVSALRKFGDRGQTIACTIHQPRADIFAKFDNLLLMAEGETMYWGAIPSIYPYFGGAGVRFDPSVNPADFIVDLTHSPEEGEEEEDEEAAAEEEGSGAGGDAGKPPPRPPSVQQLVAHFGRSEARATLLKQIDAANAQCKAAGGGSGSGFASGAELAAGNGGASSSSNASSSTTYAQPLLMQWAVLLRRMAMVDWRNPAFVAAFPLNGFVLMLQGLTYVVIVQPPEALPLSYYRSAFASADVCNTSPQLAPHAGLNADVLSCGTALISQLGVEHAHRALLFMILNALFVNELMYVPMVHAEKVIFHREHGANAYSALAWHLAWLEKMLLSAAFKGVFYTPLYYFLSRLQLSLTSYLVAAFLTAGMGFAGSATALLVASIIPSYAAASTTFTFVVLVYQNVCGFYLSLDVVPVWLRWLSYTSVYKYAYEMFLETQVNTQTVFSTWYSVAQVFALSTFVYVFGLIYHALAYYATYSFNRSKAKFIQTGGGDAAAASPHASPALAPSSPTTPPPAASASSDAYVTPAAAPSSAAGSNNSAGPKPLELSSSERSPAWGDSLRDLVSALGDAHEDAMRGGARGPTGTYGGTIRALGLNR